MQIRVKNPLPGHAPFMRRETAKRLVRRSLADWHGVGRLAIVLHRETRRLSIELHDLSDQAKRMQELAVNRRIRADKAIPWNGADHRPNVFHDPFTASVFPHVTEKIRDRVPA